MKKRIITISRQYGSGGREIGALAAKKLGIPFYDSELINIIAKESGLAAEFIKEAGEYAPTPPVNLALSGLPGYGLFSLDTLPMADKLYLIQHKVITALAEKEPCVIVGRSADYILKDRDDCLNVFIHAMLQQRVQRAIKDYHMEARDPEKEVLRVDAARSRHYAESTDEQWGMAKNYHISLDSGEFGIEKCVDIIVELAK